MAPSHSRQLLVWTLPTIVGLLSYLWFRRKRLGVRSDPGGTSGKVTGIEKQSSEESKSKVDESVEEEVKGSVNSSEKKFSRSLSGVETEPIDIIIPRELRSVKSNPVHISDEELDQHIEKIKSMKSTGSCAYGLNKSSEKLEEYPEKAKFSIGNKEIESNNNQLENLKNRSDNHLEMAVKGDRISNGGSHKKNSGSSNTSTPKDKAEVAEVNDAVNLGKTNEEIKQITEVEKAKESEVKNESQKQTQGITKVEQEKLHSELDKTNDVVNAESNSNTPKSRRDKESNLEVLKSQKTSNLKSIALEKSSLKQKDVEKFQVQKITKVNGEKSSRHRSGAEMLLKEKTSRSDKTLRSNTEKNGKVEGKKTQRNKKGKNVQVQLTNLKIDSKEFKPKESSSVALEPEVHRQSNERDSANHSPVDVMLASPSLSSISDNQSEGSSDSGKGGSVVATPPSRTPAVNDLNEAACLARTVYDFIIPQSLVGKFIGRGGCCITEIKTKTNTHILVKVHPNNKKVRLCVIEGTSPDIEKALKLIRDKFPIKRYPEVTLEQCFLAIPAIQLNPDALYLRLVEGIDNDTVLSCIVKPNHIFLQQPTHPTFMGLGSLTYTMNVDYNSPDSPRIPGPIPESCVCAGFSVNQWYRVLILANHPEEHQAYVTFLDYGGYAYIDYNDLRQIRPEYLNLPFQAQGCILAGIKSIGDVDEWPQEAYDTVSEITSGHMLCAQIDGFNEFGDPLVHIYALIPGKKAIYLNKELVDRGYAEWLPEQYRYPSWGYSYAEVESFEEVPLNYQEFSSETEGAVGGIMA